MIKKKSFPANVIEIFDFMESGPILEIAYSKPIHHYQKYTDLNIALENYTNQDVEHPKYFLLDITSSASGGIPISATDGHINDLNHQLIEYDEQEDFFNLILDRIDRKYRELDITTDQSRMLADVISGDLYICAKSRLLLTEPHPYFEIFFEVYKDQGFPCGWVGGDSWKKGEFLIYMRS